MKYEDVVARLKSGEHLNEDEIKMLLQRGKKECESSGEEYRWAQEVFTILNIDDELWGVVWWRDLTGVRDDDCSAQPRKVVKAKWDADRYDFVYDDGSRLYITKEQFESIVGVMYNGSAWNIFSMMLDGMPLTKACEKYVALRREAIERIMNALLIEDCEDGGYKWHVNI